MDWFFLTLVCAHLMIGLFCGHLAYETKQKAEPWFLAGTLLGALALVGFLVHYNRKRFAGH